MANETNKALPRRAKDPLFQEVFHGLAIDLGGGNDPLHATPEFPNLRVEWVIDRVTKPGYLNADVESFGEHPGQENFIGRYDLVYSSQTLEHVANPFRALWNWWRLVKVGGHLVITVPDEQRYEMVWPHRWNSSHKTTWRETHAAIPMDWGPGSIPLKSLLQALSWSHVLKCHIEDTGYDYDLLARIQLGEAEPVDQTMSNAEAFIEAVVKKVG